MSIISIYQSAKDKEGKQINIKDVIVLISSGQLAAQTDFYRGLKSISKDTFKKNKLQGVTWSGLFTKRNKTSLKKHSGLICIDIDKLEKDVHDNLKEQLKKDQYIYFLFTSPSGNGLKIIFKIPPHEETHLQSFEAIRNYLLENYETNIDPTGKDVCRLCFLCHDADSYYNDNAVLFSRLFDISNQEDPKKFEKVDKEETTGFTQLETLFDVHNFTSNKIEYVEGNRNRFIYLFAANASRKGFGKEETRAFIFDNYPDREKEEINQTVNNAYYDNQQDFGRYAKRNKNENATKKISSNRKDAESSRQTHLRNSTTSKTEPGTKDYGIEGTEGTGKNISSLERGTENTGKEEKKDIKFWYETENEKTGKSTIHLHYTSFYEFLESKGFANLRLDNVNVELVHVKDNIVSPVIISKTKNDLKTYMNDYCKGNKIRDVLEMLNRGQSKYFSRDQFVNLAYKKIEFLKDTPETSYHFHSNCVVECRAEGITVRDYKTGEKSLWEAQINPVPFHYNPVLFGDSKAPASPASAAKILVEADKRITTDMTDCEMLQYQLLVSCSPTNEVEINVAHKRLLAHATSFGYLINNFKPSDGIAIIGVDHNKAADISEQNGRTGKGLLSKAIGFVTKRFAVDAQRYDPKDQSVFEGITMDTKVITMDDCGPRFDFRNFFVPITEDFTLRKMYTGYITIPYEMSPKWYFNTNFTFKGDGASFNARQHVIEFDNYFNERHRPIEFFKHSLFRDWDAAQWNMFYNYAYECDSLYRALGLVNYEGGNYSERKLNNECPEEFIDIFQDIDEKTGQPFIRKHYLNRFFSKTEIVTAYNKICESNNMRKPTAKGIFSMVKKFAITRQLGFFQRKANSEDEYWIGNMIPAPMTKTIKCIVIPPTETLKINQTTIF